MKKDNSVVGRKTSFSIYHDLVINTSTEKVFRAISDPTDLINWWPLKCDGNPVLNETYNFHFSEEYNWYGKVKEVVPNKSFYITMIKSDANWENTTFGFNLKEEGNSVLISFSHTDWPFCNHHYKRSSFCWALLLNGLKNYLENGVITPFEERN